MNNEYVLIDCKEHVKIIITIKARIILLEISFTIELNPKSTCIVKNGLPRG